ncbi:MAG TPA: hypothetical protein VF710_17095, partial [Longimicrobium sp.]
MSGALFGAGGSLRMTKDPVILSDALLRPLRDSRLWRGAKDLLRVTRASWCSSSLMPRRLDPSVAAGRSVSAALVGAGGSLRMTRSSVILSDARLQP